MKTFTKKIIAICIFTLGIFVNKSSAINYVSAGAGPVAWNVATSWTPNGIPTLSDNVTISAGHTINSTANGYCNDLIVSGTLSFTVNSTITVKGNYTVSATGIETSSVAYGTLQFNTAGKTLTIVPGGSVGTNIFYSFYGSFTIAAGSIISKISTTTSIKTGVTLTNLGTYTAGNVTTSTGAVWVNGASAILTITKTGFMLGRTFTASAAGNSVSLQYASGSVPVTSSGYNNLTIISSGTKTLLSNTIILGNFTVNATNTLNSNGFDISVAGNWTNSGTFTASAGKTVTFNGTTAQSVSNSAGTTTLKGLTISNTAGVTLTSGTYILNEVLTVSNGTFNTGGRPFTMTSTAAQTARIAPITGTGAISGSFTIQRFISARDTTFADFSSPVQSSTFLDWDNELPAISYNSAPPAQQASASTYSETADVYVPVTSSATALTPGLGFEIFLSGDFAYANLPATTLNTIGVPNQGDQNFSGLVSNTVQGWNLVGNPYASSIAWSSIYTASGGAGSGMWDYIEMYDYTIADWAGYTSASGIEIGATQGFWVYGLAGPMTLIIPESSKTTASNSSIKAPTRLQPYFTLKMGSSNSSAAHIFKVAATTEANDGLDNKDIPFRASLNKATPEMYCMLDGKKININNFNLSNDSYSIPLKTKVTFSGNYKMEASGFDFVADYTCITLQDNLTGKVIDLTDGNGYCFTMNASDNVDRFILHFSKDSNCKSLASAITPSSDFDNQVEILPSAQGNIVNFNLSETTNTNISIVNVLGQTIVEPISLNANTQSVNIALPEDYSGMYIIKIESVKGSITKKFIKK